MVTDTENSEHYPWGEGCEGWRLLKRDDLSVIQERVPAGKHEIRHYHNRSRQFFYILEGEAAMVVGDKSFTLRKNQGIEIPPGIAHQFRNDSESDVFFLVISAPKSQGDRVEIE